MANNKKYDSTYSILVDILEEVKQGGGSCNLQEVSTTLTTNGPTTITADPGFDGISTANVTVAVPEPYLIPLEVTKNGTYVPEMDVDGYSDVTVNVPTGGGGPIRLADHPDMRLGGSKFTTFTNDDFDFSGMTDLSFMFMQCPNLTSIPEINLSSAKDISYMFYNCKELTSLPLLDVSQVEKTNSITSYCYALANLGGFRGLKVDLNLYDCILTHDSIMNVINEAATVTNSPTLTLGAESLALITDEEKAVATGKGWILA